MQLDAAIDPTLLRLEVFPPEPPFPPCTLQPESIIDPNGRIDVAFKNQNLAGLGIHIAWGIKDRAMTVGCLSQFPSPDGAARALRLSDVERELNQAISTRNQQRNLRDKLSEKDPRREPFVATIKSLSEHIKRLQEISTAAKAIHRQAPLHYRIFLQYPKRAVDLYDSRLSAEGGDASTDDAPARGRAPINDKKP